MAHAHGNGEDLSNGDGTPIQRGPGRRREAGALGSQAWKDIRADEASGIDLNCGGTSGPAHSRSTEKVVAAIQRWERRREQEPQRQIYAVNGNTSRDNAD